jgi:PAS domain S-box-containing protein
VRPASGDPEVEQTLAHDALERAAGERAVAELARAQRIAHVGSWSWDPATDEVQWSDEMFRIHGLEPADVAPSLAAQQALMTDETRQEVVDVVRLAVESGQPQQVSFDLRRPDGEIRHVVAHTEAIRGPGGAVERLHGSLSDVTELRRAEQAVRDQARLIDLAHDAVIVRAPDSHIAAWSDGAEKTYGWTAAEAVGRVCHELLDTVFPVSLEDVEHTLAAVGEWRGMLRHRSRDGRELIVDSRWSTDLDAAGRVRAVLEVNRDVTAEHTARLALAASEERFRTMFESAPLGVALVDSATGLIEEVNPRFAEIMGRPREAVTGIDWLSLSNPDDAAAGLIGLARVRQGDVPGLRTIQQRLRPDGSVVWVAMTIAIVASADPAHPRHLAMIEDITERKASRDAVTASRAELAEAQRIAHVGSWSWDPATDRVEWSDEVFRVFGLDPALGAPDIAAEQAMYTEESRVRLAEGLAHTIETGQPYELPVEVERRDGEIRHVMARGEAVRTPDGLLARVHGTIADVTELREAERAAREALARLDAAERMEMVGRLAGGIAHDFNNLLMTINGYAEYLGATIPAGDERRSDVEGILEAGTKAALLTRQLLAFGQRQTLRSTVLDLDEVLAGISPMLRSVAGERVGILVRTGAAAAVRVDRTMLEQAIVSLVLNARDAMPSGGLVTIESAVEALGPDDPLLRPPAAPGDYVRISVTDAGVGIEPDVLPHVFEPFFTTKPLGHGSGLGLSSVDGAIAQSGGFVTVVTEPGQGSTFSIHLPLASPVRAPEPQPVGPSSVSDRSTTVLVVDDEPGVLTITARIVRGLGHTVVEAADPASALALVAGGVSPDLLVTDVVMPGMHGRALAEKLSEAHPGLAVLYMSGYSPETVFGDGMLEEGTPYLEKPFSREDLAAQVAVLLERRLGRRATAVSQPVPRAEPLP